MTLYRKIATFLSLLIGMAAYAQNLSPDPQVEKDFELRKSVTKDQTPFKIFDDKNLQGDRLEAMKFLYSYMPLPDIAGYAPEFILENVDVTLKAREEMPWGKDIPEQEFLHFVLPLRVNNEPLDSSRIVFYEELKDRVKDLTIKEAILETNHWCHEKVSYKPSDGRTSSPLSSLSQAIGRCGEESTFTVAALRAIGIPARQVYTPRWAHTDDNHAWVEAYADGNWYFFGACEPEPVLNLGWFNEPASRGLLMTSNVIGKYSGEEENLAENDVLTTINVTKNYAVVDTINVIVKDINGEPVENCKVNYCIYNYAEFYPAATKYTNKEGKSSLLSGEGDMVVWATDGTKFGFAKGNSANKELVEVILDKDPSYQGSFDLMLTPAPPRPNIPKVSDQMREQNSIRFSREDSIRNAYIATFATPETAKVIAQKLGVNPQKLTKILTESRGNHANIEQYLANLAPNQREKTINILLAVTEKDRRDIPIDVLNDQITTFVELFPDSLIFNDYVLNPRIEREPLVPYKSFLSTRFNDDQRNEFRKNPALLAEWVNNNINVDNKWNPQNFRMDPIAVWNQKEATPLSTNIFFVALARSLGIPARIDPVTNITQYLDDNKEWQQVKFGQDDSEASPKGKIWIDFSPTGRITDPLYYSQFSFSRLNNGVPVQMEFDDNERLSSINKRGQELEEGQYIMLSGQRLADGSVMVKGNFFNLPSDTLLNVALEIPQDVSKLQVIGNLDAENIYYDMDLDMNKSILSTTGRGYYILGLILPNHEPSKHILNDLIASATDFEGKPEQIIFLFPDKESAAKFDKKEFQGLPSNVHFGVDPTGNIKKELIGSLALSDDFSMPLILVADTFNRIVYQTTGYTIGGGERLLDVLSALE